MEQQVVNRKISIKSEYQQCCVVDPENIGNQIHTCSKESKSSCLLHYKDFRTHIEKRDHSETNNGLVNNVIEIEKTVLVQPDGGWGWMVAIGGFLVTALLPSVGPCFGILFSEFLIERGTSSTTTFWIFNMQMFMWHVLGPIVSPLALEFGWRKVGAVGVLLTAFAIMLSAFSPSAGFLFFSFSFISGIGCGLAVNMSYIIVPQYFDKKKGLSNALLMTGISVGHIAGAPLIRYLLDQYGFMGAALIFGAILLNGLVGISVFHPVQWHMKKSTHVKRIPAVEATSSLTKGNDINSTKAKSDDIPKLEENHPNATGNTSKSTSKYEKEIGSSETVEKGSRMRVVKRIISDLKIVKMHRAKIICSGVALCLVSYMNFLMQIPFAMQADNFSLQDASWCISIFGITNMAARFVISALADLQKFNIRVGIMAGYAVSAVSMFVFPFLNDFKYMMIVMIVMGSGVGANMSLNTLVIIKYMGLPNMAPTFGMTTFTVAIGCVTLGPLVGVIRDISHSYVISMWILSAMSAGSFFLWFLMPAAVRLDEEKLAKQNARHLNTA